MRVTCFTPSHASKRVNSFFAELEAGLPTSQSLFADAHTTDEISISFHIHNFFTPSKLFIVVIRKSCRAIKMHSRVLSIFFHLSTAQHCNNSGGGKYLWQFYISRVWIFSRNKRPGGARMQRSLQHSNFHNEKVFEVPSLESIYNCLKIESEKMKSF